MGSNPTGGIDVRRECYVLSSRRLCYKLITRPEEFIRLWCVVVCDLETSWIRRPWPPGGCCANNIIYSVITMTIKTFSLLHVLLAMCICDLLLPNCGQERPKHVVTTLKNKYFESCDLNDILKLHIHNLWSLKNLKICLN